jgi:hypothetical protein
MIVPVLLTPEGFGICRWDAEEMRQFDQNGVLKTEARRRFVPFDRCDPADKAFVLEFIEPMLDELMDIASVAGGEFVKGATVAAGDYFEARAL